MNKEKEIIISLAINAAHRLFLDVNADSSSDEEDISGYRIREARQGIKRKETYIEHCLHGMTARQFQMHFRLSLTTFEMLLPKVDAYIRKEHLVGRNRMSTSKQLLVTIWILATPDSYRSISEKFDMGISSLSRSFERCVQALNKMALTVIKWPTEDEMVRIAENMYNIAGVDNVVGAIDGTLIPIKAPREDPEVYITRKCNHAMTLQAVCINNLKFTNCYVGYPGSVSDTRIFKNSDLYVKVNENQAEYFYNQDYFIVGDNAYPILEWCIPPYIDQGNLTVAKKYFNHLHFQTRQVIARAFALLFGRFRRLKYLDMNRTALIPATVLAACVLHNLCLDNKDLLIDEYINEGQISVAANDNHSDHTLIINDEVRRGHGKRDRLCQEIYEVRE